MGGEATTSLKDDIKESKVIKVGWIFEYKSPPIEKFPPNCESFVHIHNHTEYSLLDGLSRIERGILSLDLDSLYEGQLTLVRKAVFNKQPGVAITDHGSLGAFFRFHTEAANANINPIIGIEWYVVEDLEQIRQKPKNYYYHLTMFAKNYEGLLNLFHANKVAWTKGFYYRPKVDFETLKKYSENTILLSGCGGDSPFLHILNSDWTPKKKRQSLTDLTNQLIDIWKDDFYFEIMPHDYDQQIILNEELINLSLKFGIPLVATNDTHYLSKGDEKIHEVMLCIQTHDKMTNPKHWKFSIEGLYLKTRQEMKDTFLKYHSYIPEEMIDNALDNTVHVHGKVHIDIPKKHELVPKPLTKGMGRNQYFKKLLKDGWGDRQINNVRSRLLAEKRNISRGQAKKLYMEQLKKEWRIINELGFVDYLLIIYELVSFVRENNIAIGPGRGSAAASLICYLLGITSVDPLMYDLMFERFISKYKVSLPDIDLDFDWKRRGEIFEWMKKRFGEKGFAHIATYGVLKGKAVLRDVGRVWDVPYSDVDRITKHVIERTGGDERKSMTVEDSFKEFDTMKEFDKLYPQVKKYAIRLEGTIKSGGCHPCGVIVSDTDLTDIVPIETRGVAGQDRVVVSAVTGKECEKLGLLKIDILGLKVLSIIQGTLKIC